MFGKRKQLQKKVQKDLSSLLTMQKKRATEEALHGKGDGSRLRKLVGFIEHLETLLGGIPIISFKQLQQLDTETSELLENQWYEVTGDSGMVVYISLSKIGASEAAVIKELEKESNPDVRRILRNPKIRPCDPPDEQRLDAYGKRLY